MSGAFPHPPAEWAPHRAIWTAFPAEPELWPYGLAQARLEVAAMVRALAEPGPDGRQGDQVNVLVKGEDAIRAARLMLPEGTRIFERDYGDIWLRDTGPIFYGPARCAVFSFNGWGEKFRYPGDESVGACIAQDSGAEVVRFDTVLEGGSLDWDGEGTALSTRECLLNPNRNPGLGEADLEAFLASALGVVRLIWLPDGLMNDHTDGHVDNIARFLAPGVVACQAAAGPDDPNHDRLEAIASALEGQRDARGRRLRVVRIPSPGRRLDARGEIAPASHMNFIIGNASVIVPIYEGQHSQRAIEALRPWFPGRRVVGLSARSILDGGGAFHCITQQEPA